MGFGGRALHNTLQLVIIDVIRWCENGGGSGMNKIRVNPNPNPNPNPKLPTSHLPPP